MLAAMTVAAQTPPPGEPIRLRVLGGLAGVNQSTKHEEPFWRERLPALSQGRLQADLVPFDRAGLRTPEVLGLLRAGTAPFGTLILGQLPPREADLAALDLPGMSPQLSDLRRALQAFRPYAQAELRSRHGLELLAVYIYPAQVLWCRQPLAQLGDVKGRRVRTSGLAQSQWVEALGAVPVATPFADIVSRMRLADIDCAITGTMSGNTIGLHEHSTHLHAMAISWGMSYFVAHGASFAALPPAQQALLRRGLAQLENEIWAGAERETQGGIDCNQGSPKCVGGQPGRMRVVPAGEADLALARRAFAQAVLPRWVERCAVDCTALWQRTLAASTGVALR